MTFKELAEYFEKLEGTSSRLALIDILAELFKKVTDKDIAKVSYLIQGRVAPFYEPIEIGMAEKSVAGALSRAYGEDREEVLKEYGKVGDLGKVAQRLAGKARDGGLTVDHVFRVLREIADTNGEGTVEKKTVALSDLLKNVDPISAKHLARIPLGTSRLGIGDPTVLDAFALAKLGDRKRRVDLEGACRVRVNLKLRVYNLDKAGVASKRLV